MAKAVCETCLYFFKDVHSVCRRYPPVYAIYGSHKDGVGLASISSISAHPIVMPTDWCGEHTPKEENDG